jgi:NADPH:quinone reductase-like Zn-dependent oxidoreductase
MKAAALDRMAVQFAAQQRAHVIATASGKPAARLVRRLGANAIIDARHDAAIDRLTELSGKGIDAVFASLNRRLNRSGICVPIAATYPLARAADAHRRLNRGRIAGRIVLRIGSRQR